MSVNGPLFYLGAVLTVAGAGAVVTLRDMRSAVGAFAVFGLAQGLLLLVLGADLVAGVEILVCSAVAPAVVLAGMVLTRDPAGGPLERERTRAGILGAVLRRWPLALVVAAGLVAVILGVVAASRGSWVIGDYPREALDHGTASALGRVLVNAYALPLEVSALLLLAAAVAASVLSRRDRMERDMDRAERERAEREERMRRRREDRIRAREGRRPGGDPGVRAAAHPSEEDGG